MKPRKPIRKTRPIVLREISLGDIWKGMPLLRLWFYGHCAVCVFFIGRSLF